MSCGDGDVIVEPCWRSLVECACSQRQACSSVSTGKRDQLSSSNSSKPINMRQHDFSGRGWLCGVWRKVQLRFEADGIHPIPQNFSAEFTSVVGGVFLFLVNLQPWVLNQLTFPAMLSSLSRTLFGCFSSPHIRQGNRNCSKTTGDGNKNCWNCVDC